MHDGAWNGRLQAAATAAAALMVLGGCGGLPRSGTPGQVLSCENIASTLHEHEWTGGGLDGSTQIASIPKLAAGADWRSTIEHWRVYNDDPNDATPDFVSNILLGVESDIGKTAVFKLKNRAMGGTTLTLCPTPAGQTFDPNEQAGAAIHLEHGFAFITFRWPLIWVKNIDAGSLGTTAVARRVGNTVQLFLIRNAAQPDGGTPMGTDCDTSLSIDSGDLDEPECIDFADHQQWHIVMCEHTQAPISEYFRAVTNPGTDTRTTWRFDVQADGSGNPAVTPEVANDPDLDDAAAFLEEILCVARARGIYSIPIDCPTGGGGPPGGGGG